MVRKRKKAQLAMSLRGFAQRMLGDLTRDQLTNYESVLTQRFNPTKREKRLPIETTR